jgi:hypothetical protein
MAFVVEFPAGWWLRGTAATGAVERATQYRDKAAARDGLCAARKFLRPRAFKAARIVPAPETGPFDPANPPRMSMPPNGPEREG